MRNPFTMSIYTSGNVRQGWITDPVSISGTVRFNGMGNFEIRLRADDPMNEFMLDRTARLIIEYRGSVLMSGKVRDPQGGILVTDDIVYQVQDDYRWLINTLAWVRPTEATYPLGPSTLEATVPEGWGQAWLPGGGSDAGPNGTTQGQYGYYYWPDGSSSWPDEYVSFAESCIKAIVIQNLRRITVSRPVEAAPDLERGGDARADNALPLVRMQPLTEAIEPLLIYSGLGVSLLQQPGNPLVTLDVYEPTVWPQVLTVESGIIRGGTWSLKYPTATTAMIGGPGENVDRAFTLSLDETGEGALYEDQIEVFRDATGAKVTWPNGLAEQFKVAKYLLLRPDVSAVAKDEFARELYRAAQQVLREGQATSGLSLELSETGSFYFGGDDGIQLGDTITARRGSGPDALTFTNRVTECAFSLTADKGFVVTPKVGETQQDADRYLADQITKVAASIRRMNTSR